MALEDVLKYFGAVPKISRPEESRTTFQLELNKIKYRIGAISYKPGQEYLMEPIQWDIVKKGIYDTLRNH